MYGADDCDYDCERVRRVCVCDMKKCDHICDLLLFFVHTYMVRQGIWRMVVGG